MSLSKFYIWDGYQNGSHVETVDEAVKNAKRRASKSNGSYNEVGIYQLIKKAEVPTPEINVVDVA